MRRRRYPRVPPRSVNGGATWSGCNMPWPELPSTERPTWTMSGDLFGPGLASASTTSLYRLARGSRSRLIRRQRLI